LHYKYYFRMREVEDYTRGAALMGARRSQRSGRVSRRRPAPRSLPGVGKQRETQRGLNSNGGGHAIPSPMDALSAVLCSLHKPTLTRAPEAADGLGGLKL